MKIFFFFFLPFATFSSGNKKQRMSLKKQWKKQKRERERERERERKQEEIQGNVHGGCHGDTYFPTKVGASMSVYLIAGFSTLPTRVRISTQGYLCLEIV